MVALRAVDFPTAPGNPGVKSTIERIIARLEGQHWMFPGAPDRTRLIKVCAGCRVVAAVEGHVAAHPSASRPVRTTEDYLARGAAHVSRPLYAEVA